MPQLQDLTVGAEINRREYTFTRDTLVRYAGASGDFNPIHYRDDVAAAVGLPGVLAHGMLTMGAAVSVVTDWLGAHGYVLETNCRFTRPVVVDPQAGAVVTVTATVAAVDLEQQQAVINLHTVYAEKTVLAKAQVRVAFAQG